MEQYEHTGSVMLFTSLVLFEHLVAISQLANMDGWMDGENKVVNQVIQKHYVPHHHYSEVAALNMASGSPFSLWCHLSARQNKDTCFPMLTPLEGAPDLQHPS